MNDRSYPAWQRPIVRGLVEAFIAEGVYEYRRDIAAELLKRLTEADAKLPLKEQVGYRNVAGYKRNGLSRLLNRVAPLLEERVANDPDLRPAPRESHSQQPAKSQSAAAVEYWFGEQEPLVINLRVLLDKENYTQDILLTPLQQYLDKQCQPAKCDILAIVPDGGCWYILKIRTTAAFQDVWDWLDAISWVSELQIRP